LRERGTPLHPPFSPSFSKTVFILTVLCKNFFLFSFLCFPFGPLIVEGGVGIHHINRSVPVSLFFIRPLVVTVLAPLLHLLKPSVVFLSLVLLVESYTVSFCCTQKATNYCFLLSGLCAWEQQRVAAPPPSFITFRFFCVLLFPAHSFHLPLSLCM
jgi:hypothetical protein